MFHVAVTTNTWRGQGSLGTEAITHVELGIDASGISGHFLVTDEDGTPLVEVEAEFSWDG